MKNFIKATEIWVPNEEKTELSLSSGLYGENSELESYSQSLTFKYNDGLPGKAWAMKQPIILNELSESFFKRTELVTSIGLTCAIAMPIYAGEYLQAVVVFLCGDSDDHAGAIEVWKASEDRINEMGLVNGYFGTMKDFEWISKSIKIMKGQGLPGSVWKTKEPVIMDLSLNATFMRSSKAIKEGITTALGIPAWINEEDGYVMTFLSAKGTPIARRFEIWTPNASERKLSFKEGYTHGDKDLNEMYSGIELLKDKTLFGKTWKTGVPQLAKSTEFRYAPSDSQNILTIPVLQNGFCTAVIAFYY